MQAGILDQVPLDGAADGGDVAHVLHHGGKGDGDDHEDGGDQEARVEVLSAEEAEDGVFHLDGQADPGSFLHAGEIHIAGDCCHQVGHQNAHQDGDDLDHALAPDVADDDNHDGHQGDPPVGGAGVDGGGGQDQADGDDDGAGNHRREEAHHVLGAEGLANEGQHQVQKAGTGNAHAGVGQSFRLAETQLGAGGHDGKVAAQEGEGGAQEHGDLFAGDQMHEERGKAREEQGGGNAQPGQDGDQHRGAEHGEQMLQAQHQHLRGAEDLCVVNRLVKLSLFFFTHDEYLSLYVLFLLTTLLRRVHQVDAGLPVKLRQANLHQLLAGGGQVFAHKIRPDGKLPVAPVHGHGQLDAPGAAAGEDGLDGGPGGAAGVDHIVHQHQIPVIHIKGQLSTAQLRHIPEAAQIIPVKGDVHAAHGDLPVLDLLDILGDAAGNGLAPAAHTHQAQVLRALVVLQDLMGDAHQGPVQPGLVLDLRFELHSFSPRKRDSIHKSDFRGFFRRNAGKKKCPASRQDTQRRRCSFPTPVRYERFCRSLCTDA